MASPELSLAAAEAAVEASETEGQEAMARSA